jgi:hypothetical protein
MSVNAGVGDGRRGAIARASLADTLRIFGGVMLPTFGKGILIRRPTMEAAAERMGIDTGAVTTMQYLRRKYGSTPLLLAIPGRPQLLLFDPRDVARVLTGSPQPFRTDTKEKRAALNHFEPGNVLIAEPNRRAALRPMHEAALATSSPLHPLISRFREVIRASIAVSCERMDARLHGICLRLRGFAWCAGSSSGIGRVMTKTSPAC